MTHLVITMQIQSILQQASNYFLEPWALVLLAGIVPLVIFYLVKPKPEEVMLPSLRFFAEDRKNTRIRSALRLLRRNAFLLLHMLIITGLALAAAQPYMDAEVEAEKTVLVLDRSASMNDEFGEAKEFLKNNLGNQNTLILVDEKVKIKERSVDSSTVADSIDSTERVQTETDIASALRRASSMEGRVYIASDMDQSAGNQKINSILEGLRTDHDVQIMETDQDNSWGIVRATPGRTTKIDVENFEGDIRDVGINYGNKETEVTLEPGETRTLELDMKEGRNTVELEEDGYSPDNNYHVYIPREKNFKTVIVGENPYMEEAFELINFTEVENVGAGTDDLPDADIHILTDSSDILPSTREEALSRNSLTILQQSRSNLRALGLEGESVERKVSIEGSVNTYVGETEVLNISTEGYSSLSTPGNALMSSENDSVIVYNIEDEDFNRDFMYPVFWKRLTEEMLDVPGIESRNLDTVGMVRGEKILKSGFVEKDDRTYAVNHVNRDESVAEKTFIRSPGESSAEGERNLSYLVALLLVFIALTEYAYLESQGDVR